MASQVKTGNARRTNGPFKYPIIRPALPDLDRLRKEMAAMWEIGQVTAGGFVRAFEETVEKEIGVRHAVAVSSCTSGLMLAARALELKGEVVLPTFTFAATAHALVWNGLTPVFCDSEPGTLTLDPEKAEACITEKTSAICPVAIFGVPPRVEELERIARRRRVRLLFDSAQSLGARIGETCTGSFGDLEVFSLSPTKVVTAIEGGLVTTDDDTLAKRIRRMRDYGKAADGEDMEFVGLSARMSEVHAAVGLLNFRRIEDLIRTREMLVALYRKLLSGRPGVRFQAVPEGIRPTHNYMVIFVDETAGRNRDELYSRLKQEGIQTKRYFFPVVHEMTAYARWGKKYKGKLPIAEGAALQALALPLYDGLGTDDVRYICSRICAILDS